MNMYRVFLGMTLLSNTMFFAMDNYHWYRPPFFYGEPRLLEPHLTSLDFLFAGGSTCTSRNKDCCNETALWNLHGAHNMHNLGSYLPGKNLQSIEDVALIDLDRVTGRDCFGYLVYGGFFRINELQMILTQNIKNGLFLEAGIPIRNFQMIAGDFVDITPACGPYPHKSTEAWQNFLALYDAILARYDVDTRGYRRIAPGDLSIALGWGHNYQDMRVMDYIDGCFKLGILFPTGRKASVDLAFDIPSGYNGHYGVVGTADIAFGVYDWLTFGGHAGAIALLDKTYVVRMQTDVRQNGYIKLAKGCATVEPGNIWNAGIFVKADHVFGGFSTLFSYTYVSQHKTTLYPLNTIYFDPVAANADATLSSWEQHVVNVIADYDFSKDGLHASSRIGVFGNIILGGRHIFNTQMGGVSFGIDISHGF